ncbi:MAG: hypothetical protein Q7J55_05880 [bacterium]|nr:hypothetical protein [bacterium]
MMIIHIYSEYPDYGWVDASDEGISCVDDVSRSAIVYLRHYEVYGDSVSLEKARRGLNFVMYMEQEDGEFYNFILRDYSINTEGRTSKKSFNWWAVRGLRALCCGYRVFSEIDSAYASELKKHIELTFGRIREFLKYYGKYEFFDGVKVPKWLVHGGDATPEVILALLDYYSVKADREVKEIIKKLAEGLVQFQVKDSSNPFYGMHFSWRNCWHAWGNAQTEALAKAGRMFDNTSWIESAKLEADNFYPFLISKNFLNSIELHLEESPSIRAFPQISYGIRPMVSGLIQLYITTGDERYAKLAGLTASWLRGNNPAHSNMYDSKTGRVYDGIDNENKINKNSGAESTIEALMTLMDISDSPISLKYFYYEREYIDEIKRYALYRGIDTQEFRVGWDEKTDKWRIEEK